MSTKKAEQLRLKTTHNNHGWKKWGPYLSERQWGTVREDYSESGYAWGYLTHDLARSKAYRWGEDGIGGLSDNQQLFCMAFSFWNGKDTILKERLFGLNNGEGNHGEDVKELYYYLDSSPTHSFMKMLYKYPQRPFPYAAMVDKNKALSKQDREHELLDTGIFDKNEYFDIFIEYAKAEEEDLLIKVVAHNRSDVAAPLHILPTFWFRNTWSWGNDDYRPTIYTDKNYPLVIEHRDIGNYYLYYEQVDGSPEALFCDNDTNVSRLGQPAKKGAYYKDAIHEYVVKGDKTAVNPEKIGTKAALHYQAEVPPKGSVVLRLRMSKKFMKQPFKEFEQIVDLREDETDAFYEDLQLRVSDPELRNIQRQAYAGMLWNKQFYYYNVNQWINGDPNTPPLPSSRKYGRNHRWKHLVNANIISMPDKWEYPWYAAWDLAFHCATLAKLDASFAKRQLLLLLREYYMHPNGQIPAYEWSFSDVNPPVHAWGAWQVYTIDQEKNNGVGDTDFLARVFLKLQMNFTWWINQKDTGQNNLFEGGFLGLDNIGVFDRSNPLPNGKLEQSDATSWMAMYSLNMLRIALELSKVKPYYQEMASKYFEHFLIIAGAMTNFGDISTDLWDEDDAFYYDVMHVSHQPSVMLKVRSLVGLLPLFAVEIFSEDLLRNNPDFTRRLEHALANRPDLASKISRWFEQGKNENRMLSLVRVHRMKCILRRMLDEEEFLSDYGIRALSKYHLKYPYHVTLDGVHYSIQYLPGESDSSMFGGNSNWRGPIWFPVNYILVQSLYKFHAFYGDEFKLEFPTGSGKELNLKEIAEAIIHRLIAIFKKNSKGERVVFGSHEKLQTDPHFRDYILFYEYFHGDNGEGLGASHQTGWTGLVANLIDMLETGKRS